MADAIRLKEEKGATSKQLQPAIPSEVMRLYPIAPRPAYQIIAGLIGDNQVLVYPLRQAYLMLRFTKDGVLFNWTEQPIPDPSTAARFRKEWLLSQGFKSRTISVKRFYLPEFHLGIKQIPDSMREAIERPERFHPSELGEIYNGIAAWITDGLFVLCWNKDYYVDGKGRVVSS